AGLWTDSTTRLQYDASAGRWLDPKGGTYISQVAGGRATGDTSLYRYADNSWPNQEPQLPQPEPITPALPVEIPAPESQPSSPEAKPSWFARNWKYMVPVYGTSIAAADAAAYVADDIVAESYRGWQLDKKVAAANGREAPLL